MRLSNETVYPITRKFEMFLIEQKVLVEEGGALFWNLPLQPGEVGSGFNNAQDAAKVMHETLGEYEHGGCSMSDADSYNIIDEALKDYGGEFDEPLPEATEQLLEQTKLKMFEAVCEDLILMMIATSK